MAELHDIDTTDAQELGEGFAPLPPGEYTAYVDASERKYTKDGGGEYLATTWLIHGGEYEGRKVFCNFNLWNKNETAVSIAKSQWRAVCEATAGRPSISNSEEIHHKKCIITLELDQYKDKINNKIVFKKDTIRPLGLAATVKATVATVVKKKPW